MQRQAMTHQALRRPGFLLVLLLALPGVLGAAQTEIPFVGTRVKILFHPPLRTGPLDPHPMWVEIPRLNLITLHLENYLTYLTRLGKLPEAIALTLHYYPDGTEEFIDGTDRLMIMDLGWNNLLDQVNRHLRRRAEGTRPYLIDNAASLFQIRDQLPRTPVTFETRHRFTNLSSRLEALAPEADFALLGTDSAVAVRPTETHNQLVRLPFDGTGTVLLASGRAPYGHLRPAPSGAYLGFTEGGEPKILDLAKGETVPLYPGDRSKLLLDAGWSPDGKILAGIVLDRNTAVRDVFLFDAARRTHLTFFQGHGRFQGDYQFPYPYWAPDSRRVLFTDGHAISLLDLETSRLRPEVVKTSRTLAEILWSPDGRSFATVEMEGKSRDKSEFNSKDLRGWTLRRWHVTPAGEVIEDPAQTYTSREALKLVSFWTLDRILFLEGHLRSPRIQTCLMNLTGDLAARLTPTPQWPEVASGSRPTTGFVDLPMKYCYVIRNLDGKSKNVYDSGFGHMNQLYLEDQVCTWFLGLRLPEGVPLRQTTFNLLPSPYPFQDRNVTYCQDLPAGQIKGLTETIKGYNLRRFELSDDLSRLFFLSNTRGPMTLWAGEVAALERVEVPVTDDTGQPADRRADEGKESEGPLPGEALPLPGEPPPLPGDALPLPGNPFRKADAPPPLPGEPLPLPGAGAPGRPAATREPSPSPLPALLPGEALPLPPLPPSGPTSRRP
ncbi:MAG: hypothetical protein OZSIB_0845 [Candidatus Ozemobacter sibiricus]|uniref:TolB protein n=1 Tax=Candidatus Ozemobacter sibiricus TaxID=2268124 RepID=A0A367ZWK7_9BACT|nr:MAG: hypothetical protein OZSIB_0845 [Candidatus Ozemobacter sibiricus]